MKNLESYNVILASKSPRRQELLKGMGIDFTVMATDVNESYPTNLPANDVAPYLSCKKANAVDASQLPNNYMVIAADTIVVIDNVILGKPKDEAEAIKMLKTLSGKVHKVVSGVTIRTAERCKTFATVSKVTFNALDNEEIEYYVEKYKPLDKAGAYGIQEWIGYIGVKSVEGSYFNVMGLPTQKLYQMLNDFV